MPYYGYLKREYVSLTDPDTSPLSQAELSLINEMIDFVCRRHTAKEISDVSHNKAWELARPGEELPYHTVFLMFPSDIPEETLEQAHTEVRAIAASGSRPDSVRSGNIRALRGGV